MKAFRKMSLLFATASLLVSIVGCGGESGNNSGPQAWLLLNSQTIQRVLLNTGELTGPDIPLSVAMDSIAIDPQTGQLYGFGDDGRLYSIIIGNGQCQPISPNSTGLSVNGAGMTFENSGQIRYFTASDDNVVIDPESGTVVQTDTDLDFETGDPNEGIDANIVGGGFNFDTLTFYGLDAANDVLVMAPNIANGQLETIGNLNTDFGGEIGLSIDEDSNFGYAVSNSGLYRINLGTGNASLISDDFSPQDIAVIP